MIIEDKHLILCFDSLINYYDNDHKLTNINNDNNEKYPLFVTWNHNSRLRGCIGTFKSIELVKGLRQYSLISALEDKRFDPINLRILNGLSVSISILHNFQKKQDCFDFKIGLEGIKINFYHNNHHYQSTFLPNVLTEQNWTKEQSIVAAIKKSGYSQKIDKDLYSRINLETFESEYKSMSYKNYLFLVNL